MVYRVAVVLSAICLMSALLAEVDDEGMCATVPEGIMKEGVKDVAAYIQVRDLSSAQKGDALVEALERNDLQGLTFLLMTEEDPECASDKKLKKDIKEHVFMTAAVNNAVDVLTLMLEQDAAIFVKTPMRALSMKAKETAFQGAASEGSEGAVRLLLQYNADWKKRVGKNGALAWGAIATAVRQAAWKGHVAVVDAIFCPKIEAALPHNKVGYVAQDALKQACMFCYPEVAESVLRCAGDTLSASDKQDAKNLAISRLSGGNSECEPIVHMW